MLSLPKFGRDARVNALICSGHFLSHYYQLCLPPMFIVWQQAFGVSYAELGLAMALMSGTTAVVQAPIGFLVDRYGTVYEGRGGGRGRAGAAGGGGV